MTIVLSYLTHLSIPFVVEPSLVSAYALGLTYAALSVPFIFQRHRRVAGADAISAAGRVRLYAADLAGAALGCLVVGPLLRLADAPTAVLANRGDRLVSLRCCLPADRVANVSTVSRADSVAPARRSPFS